MYMINLLHTDSYDNYGLVVGMVDL